MNFENDVAIVTGGAQGIGKEVVRGIIAGGGSVIIADINEEVGQKTAEELGDKASFIKMDLSDSKSTTEVMEQIMSEYPVTVLVNSAGIISTLPIQELSQEEWDRVININLTGTFVTCHAAYKYFIENGGGRIVNISSVAGKIGGGLLGTAAYATSKAGVNGLTKALAKEGGKYNIRANAVCPSYTNTEMTTALKEDKEKEGRVLAGIPLGRKAEPVEIAQMVLFFASQNSSFVTGEIGDVDGGIVLD